MKIKCDYCYRLFETKSSLSNHKRWHNLPQYIEYQKLFREHRSRDGKRRINSLNSMWKGDDVGYEGLHTWVKRKLKQPDKCQKCGKNKKLDLANISQQYKRNLDDWEWLCRKCHMISDGRLEKMLIGLNRNSNMKGIVV